MNSSHVRVMRLVMKHGSGNYASQEAVNVIESLHSPDRLLGTPLHSRSVLLLQTVSHMAVACYIK
jgi:hypothetical protein